MQVTIDLVREHGLMPSTRDIAAGAGIAEGTIFRAFDSKDALVEAVIGAIACPVPLRSALREIDPASGLRERTLAAAQLLMDRFDRLFELLGPLGIKGPPQHYAHPGCPDPSATTPAAAPGERTALVRLFEGDAADLRLSPEEFAHVLRILAFGGTARHVGAPRLTPRAVTDLVLDGALRRYGPAGAELARPDHTDYLDPNAPKECPC